ncbi:amidohydrolase family protein [Gracilibacillus caseinilyticus]|uniref:Amidohydrolase family protein n=1 Tax=Gracilibacillus caseinilyticus TaxID=2932256 RepID=A0ABY4EXV2_9BACI|nr:amidohydrolase family protein [Gracilibacillus caseinilyticus]UOQ49237.1 amidohydrolase family protein [Gracilibacillus caseinilyticus]
MQQEFDLGWHSHLLESHTQWTISNIRGESLLERMDRYHLLNEKAVFAHAIWTTAKDRKIMKERGVAIVQCACSNLHLGSGICPIHEYRYLGIPWFLGTDGFNCSPLNAFELMRESVRSSRIMTDDSERWLDAYDVFDRMIRHSPLSKDIWGQPFLKEEKRASFIAMSYENIESDHIIQEMAYYETGENVTDIMQDGIRVKRNREAITGLHKEREIRQRLAEKQMDYQKELQEMEALVPIVVDNIQKSWQYVKNEWVEPLPKIKI